MKKTGKFLSFMALLTAVISLACACDDGLDIQSAYGFALETMPVQKQIADGETAEIRCAIVREGHYSEERYYIRFFQNDGAGELRLDDGTLLAPNDLYPLENDVFRLYYTARCSEQQNIDVYIQNSAGQVVMKSFSWQNENADEGSGEDTD
jgi:hypothetical protein